MSDKNKDKSPKTTGKLNTQQLTIEIIQLFKRNPRKHFSARLVISKLKVKNSKDSAQAIIENLVKKGVLFETSEAGKYQLSREHEPKPNLKTAEGIVDMTRSGAAYIICEEMPNNDIYVPAKSLKTALNGDRVKVAYSIQKGRNRIEGEIVEVVKRATEYFVGVVHLNPKFAIVVPSNELVNMEIYVPLEDLNNAEEGEKVVARVEKWQSRTVKSPIGIITERLGKPGSNDSEMKSILIENGFELSFPPAVLEQTEAISTEISPLEIDKRKDFRAITTFTIDPIDAKDFDDALSIRLLENGDCEIGVHIADVTHYLTEDSPLDLEAYRRATSVYLVDRVLPMLPEKLSNQLCSLRPSEESLCFSAVFVFDENYKIKSEWFGKTVIFSNRRFTYEEAQERLETGEGDFAEELRLMNKIAHLLRKKRFKEGAISFEAPEVRFKLDADGTPLEVYIKERKDAHLLVEDFMLLANRRVAVRVGKRPENELAVPFVYRVHDTPNPDKIADFAAFAKLLGFRVNMDTPQQIIQAFNDLAKAAQQDESLRVLEPLAIRTMAKAIYTTENIGHYGLGFDYYTHFTSPIRRYSDVLAHRILEKNLTTPFRVNREALETRCKHISTQERRAMEAERQSVKYKQVEFMQKHVGSEFNGIITGMMERGIFVEITQTLCEGMIPIDTLAENFELASHRMSITGTNTGKTYKMGDKIRVRVLNTDIQKRQINLELVNS